MSNPDTTANKLHSLHKPSNLGYCPECVGDITAQELQDKIYEVLSYLHQQKHLKKDCFCTTEIAGPFRLMWDLFDTYASQKAVAARIDGMQQAKSRVLRRTEIPRGARNPTRDATVFLGEAIADIIQGDIDKLTKESEAQS